jgi:myosin-7
MFFFNVLQDHYDQEGIKWQHITFVDNQDILDMLGQKPMNIISLIDEESRFPKVRENMVLLKYDSLLFYCSFLPY